MRQIDGILQQIQEKKAAKQEIMNRVICPSCGKSVPAGTKFCSYCGDSDGADSGDRGSAGRAAGARR